MSGALLFPDRLVSANAFENNISWKELLDYARWSPSPHNIQPWKIRIFSVTEAELCYVPERLIPLTDQGNTFMTIGMGIFIENMRIAAEGHGLHLAFSWYGSAMKSGEATQTAFGKLLLTPRSNATPAFDKTLILQRKTSRLNYQPCPIKETTLAVLEALVQRQEHRFFSSSRERDVRAIVQLNSATLFRDLNNEQVRSELDKWLRYTDKEATAKKDGLWYHCMRFPGKLMRNFFHHHKAYSHGLIKKVINKYYTHSMDDTKTIGWISGDISSPEACLHAGKMLAQLWLEMTKQNVYMHPFGSVITNAESHAQLKDLLHCPDNTWFLFRMGYSKTPPASCRLETEELIIS